MLDLKWNSPWFVVNFLKVSFLSVSVVYERFHPGVDMCS